MTEPTVAEALTEMSSLATRVRAEAGMMRRATRRQAIAYIVAGVVIAGYLSWAYWRVARYIDADNLARITGDIAVSRSIELVFQATGEARVSAPAVVRGAETAFLAVIPQLSHDLAGGLREKAKDALRDALRPVDKAMLEEIARLPDGKRRIAAIAANPAEADQLLAELEPRLLARPEVMEARTTTAPALVALRDRVRRLTDNVGLNATEQAERRFLQVAMGRPTPDPMPAPKKP